MPSLRIFFAIELPSAAQYLMQKILSQLQSQHRDESIHYSKLKNLHITLQFLKAVQLEDIPTICKNVRAELNQFQSFHLELGQLELFPTVKRPRIISLDVKPQDIINDLSHRVGRGIQAANYDIEARPFRAHLTLARITKPWPLNEIYYPTIPPIPVDEIILFRSEPSSTGSLYSVLERIRLVPHSS